MTRSTSRRQILHQAEVALKSASHIIFLVDGRAEITGADRDLARMLQRLGKPVSVAVNKADTAARIRAGEQILRTGNSGRVSGVGGARNRRRRAARSRPGRRAPQRG